MKRILPILTFIFCAIGSIWFCKVCYDYIRFAFTKMEVKENNGLKLTHEFSVNGLFSSIFYIVMAVLLVTTSVLYLIYCFRLSRKIMFVSFASLAISFCVIYIFLYFLSDITYHDFVLSAFMAIRYWFNGAFIKLLNIIDIKHIRFVSLLPLIFAGITAATDIFICVLKKKTNNDNTIVKKEY